MNALDLLVDFAALVSIPDTSTHHQDGRNSSSNPIREITQAPSFHAGFSDAEHFQFVEEAPRNNVACTFIVDPPSPLQTFSAPASHWHKFIGGCYDMHHGPPFYTQQEHEMQWMSSDDMQQDSRLTLPYQVASGEPQPRTQYEISPPWDVRYGASYTMPSEAEIRYGPQARQMFRSTPHSDTRFIFTSGEELSSERQCNDSICQCRPPSPQYNYSASSVRPTWDIAGPLYELNALHRYNEWALASGRGEQYEGR